jgi:DNA repair protein RadD
MRPKSHTDHCRVLDFAGVVRTHGPITAIDPGKKAGTGEAPVKICPECDELVHLSVMICPACGYQFPKAEPPVKPKLHDDDIMGYDSLKMDVTSWTWRKHTSYNSGKDMFRVTYYGALSDKPVNEYLTIEHEGYAGKKAMKTFAELATKSGADMEAMKFLNYEIATDEMNSAVPPTHIQYRMNGKFHRIIGRTWE